MWVNFFPLRGDDLQLLAAATTGPLRSDLQVADDRQTVQRRLAHLRKLGLLEGHRERRGWTHRATVPELGVAANAALAERPDLADLMATPSSLSVLACLPDGNASVSAVSLSGLSRKTWAEHIRPFKRANIVLEPDGIPLVNPNLGGLHRLIQEYRRLFERVPPDVAGPRSVSSERGTDPGLSTTMGAETIHQVGLEAAWVFHSGTLGDLAVPFGPSSDQAPYQAITTDRAFAYYGPRTLDLWDHAFLYCKSERRFVPDPRAPGGKRPGGVTNRAKTLLFAMMTPDLATHDLFEERAIFYGLGGLVRQEARRVFADPGDPAWAAIRSMRDDRGIEEGYLADVA